jgi:hypothetical protein
MGYKQRQNFKKKLATRRAQRAEIAAMGQSEIPISELAPQVLQSKESKAKLRRWTFYTLITKQRFISAEGKVVDTEAEAMKDEKDQPVQKPIVHKLVTGNTVIGDEAMAKRAADEMREYYSSLDQHKGDPIKVFPVPHETVSHEVRNQMNGVKAQNDILATWPSSSSRRTLPWARLRSRSSPKSSRWLITISPSNRSLNPSRLRRTPVWWTRKGMLSIPLSCPYRLRLNRACNQVPDYNLMLENIDAAAANIKRGIESLHPMKKLTQLESYVLGHLRSAEAVLDKARDAVQKTRAIKEKPVPTRLEEDQD